MANRGTKRGKVSDATNISGEEFKRDQDKRLDDSGIEFLSSGRGTAKTPVEKTKTSKKKKYKGKISTGRGTGTRSE